MLYVQVLQPSPQGQIRLGVGNINCPLLSVWEDSKEVIKQGTPHIDMETQHHEGGRMACSHRERLVQTFKPPLFPTWVSFLMKARDQARERPVGMQQKQEWVPWALPADTVRSAASGQKGLWLERRKGRRVHWGRGEDKVEIKGCRQQLVPTAGWTKPVIATESLIFPSETCEDPRNSGVQRVPHCAPAHNRGLSPDVCPDIILEKRTEGVEVA